MKVSDLTIEFPLLRITCPHCEELSEFGLGVQTAHFFRFLGLKLGMSRTYSLICGKCGFSEFVKDEDYRKWRNLGWKYEDLNDGKISSEEFFSYVQELDLPELKETMLASTTWKCSCGKSNPPNFENCWECGSANTGEIIELESRPVDTGEWQHWKPQARPGGIVQTPPKPKS